MTDGANDRTSPTGRPEPAFVGGLATLLGARAAARLSELAARYALSPDAVSGLVALLSLVAIDPQAPTTVRNPADAVDTHVADSLTGLEVGALRGAGTIADLGAGAGFPGIVLALANPSARVALVESNAKKGAFLARAV